MTASSGRRRTALLIGAALLTAALAGAFLFYRRTETRALTPKDTVLLSSVVNHTGDTIFDDTLGEALALQLRQSPFLTLVPEQQVQATLRVMGRDPLTPITADVGGELCRRAGATALLGGSLATRGSEYVITLEARHCVGDEVIAEAEAQAPTKQSVVSAMDTAVSVLREKLGESPASIQRYGTSIEHAATTSLDALKAYSQGQRTRRTTGDFDSVPLFRRAIDLDPDFALAYARLGAVYGNLNQPEEGRRMTTRAYELRGKVSEVERLYIEARYYTTVQNDVQKALDAYDAWLSIYPNDYTALTNSAVLHKNRGERVEAIRKLELAIKAAPDQPAAYASLGQTYFEGGQYPEARRTYETAVKLADSTAARIGLYQTAIMLGDVALADQQAAAVRGRRDEVEMIGIRLNAAMYRGRFKEAADLAGDYQARMVALSRAQEVGRTILQLSIAEALVGLSDAAVNRAQKADADGILGDALLEDRAIVTALATDASGAAALWPKAIETLQTPTGLNAATPLTWLMAGRRHAGLGQWPEARNSYRKFFDIFKDADPDLPLLLQARGEFAKLPS